MSKRPGVLPLPDLAVLDVLFACDPEAGHLYRKTKRGVHLPGTKAGTVLRSGYRRVTINGGFYQEHRVIWKMVHGHDPLYDMDHINGDPADNRISNLRECTPSQNAANAGRRLRSGQIPASKYKGVSRDGTRWKSQLQVNGSIRYLGSFATEREAAVVYEAAALAIFGEFHAPQVIE